MAENRDKIVEPLIFSRSGSGKVGYSLPPLDVPEAANLSPEQLREKAPLLPEVSEVEVVRHYTKLSHLNYSLDEGFYPLGSCTMKYNPKINEKVASLSGMLLSHPYAPYGLVQGNLKIIKALEEALSVLTGLPYFTLIPSAGAHGELTGMLLIRKRLEKNGNPRKIVLIPDSAHGTNPASSHFAGYDVKQIPSGPEGYLSAATVKENLDGDVAALMMTNPNTLGIYEKEIKEIAELLHKNGSYLYMDGANFNALMGHVQPESIGVDVLHLNLHKTFSTPHGGGGPGCGAVGVRKEFEPFLPIPVIREGGEGTLRVLFDRQDSIGKVRSFFGNFSVIVKGLAYVLSLGGEGLKTATERAVLNANYLRSLLQETYHLPYKLPTLHEVVFSEESFKDFGIKTSDVAKRLLDYGFHPPTVYFPLIVHGALMMEPTESESKETLDEFAQTMKIIHKEAETEPELLKTAPHIAPIRRLDEALAAKQARLVYKPE